MAEQIVVYPGSFDPPTLGHQDLIQRAAKLFDKVIVAVAANTAKSSLFSVEERVEMLQGMSGDLPNVTIGHFTGLTIDFAKKHGAIALIRGLRAISDFEFELSMAINNQKLDPEIDTVSLMPSEPYLFLSSRLVREIATFGGPVEQFLTPEVGKRLVEKLK
jgi:pantetheine-phosphate adenylyltransferase